MFLVSLISVFFLLLLLIPSVCAAISGDELEGHEYGIMRVSSRNPVRETGPPACMAKLIMMRHRLNQANTRKRGGNTNVSQSRSPARKPSNPSLRASNRPRNVAWMRFGKQQRMGKQYH